MKWPFILSFLFLIQCQSLKKSISSFSSKSNSSKKELSFKKATRLAEKGDTEEAVDALKIISRKVSHPYYKQAEVKIADIYFESEKYEKASYHYHQVLKKHPGHKKTAFILYQIGECFYERSPKAIDRDINLMKQAYPYYMDVIQKYPKSAVFQKALERSKEILEKSFQKELYVAQFYHKINKHTAALYYFGKTFKKYPKKSKLNSSMMYQASLSAYKAKREKLGLQFYNLLRTHSPNHNKVKELEKLYTK